MIKTLKKSMALLLAVAVVLAVSIMPAFAANTVNYTPVSGTSTTFTKYLVLDTEAHVPNVRFDYTIQKGSAMTYNLGESKFQVLAGVGTPTVGYASFSTADDASMTTTVATSDDVQLATGRSYVKKTVTIDFSGCSFSEPGVYRYILTEQETSGAMGTTYDTQKIDTATAMTRYVDVYVVDKNDGSNKLEVAQYVLHYLNTSPILGAYYGTNDVDSAGAKLADKPTGYVNEYETHNLTITKTVAGNQASRDKVFAFTVKIEGAVAGTKYTVDISGANATSASNSATISDNTNKANVTLLTVGSNGSVTQTFYLSHGQSITINGLAKGTKYTITENAEDYKPTIAVTGDTTNDATDDIKTKAGNEVSDKSFEADTTVVFTNTRDGLVPTGLTVTLIPSLAALGVSGSAVLFCLFKKSKKDEDAEEAED